MRDEERAAEREKIAPESTAAILDGFPPAAWDDSPPLMAKPMTEEERTGEAIPAIIRILAELPEAQCANVFHAVQAIRQTARRSSNEITRIGDELNRIERDKARRDAAPKKKGWFR